MKPFVTALDMGMAKPMKWQIWNPYPVWYSKSGQAHHIHPKQRFDTKAAAEKWLAGREGR